MIKKVSLLCSLAFASQLHAADFMAVYRAAQENDSVLAEARAKLEAAQEKPVQGRAGLLPSIALSGNAMQNREEVENRQTSITNDWNYNSRTYTVSLTQPLFRWQNWVGFSQSKLIFSQAEVAFANARQDLILRTAQAYFDLLQAQANLDAAKGYKAAVGSQLELARQAFQLGTGIKTDMHDAETRFAAASSQVISAQTEQEVRLRALEVIAGPISSGVVGKRAQARLTTPQPADMDKWLEAAEQGNLVLQQQRFAVEIADREVERQRAGHLPTVDLVANAGKTSTLNSGTRQITDADRIGIQLNIPIFQGGEVNSRTSEAAANRRAAQAALETSRRGAILAVRQAYVGVVNGLEQVKTAEEGLLAAQNALQSNKDAFNVGVRLNIDVLNAQSQVFSAQRELNRVTVETLIAQLRLKAAVGTLGEADVSALNVLLIEPVAVK